MGPAGRMLQDSSGSWSHTSLPWKHYRGARRAVIDCQLSPVWALPHGKTNDMNEQSTKPSREPPALAETGSLRELNRIRRVVALPANTVRHTRRHLPSNGVAVNYVRHHRLHQEATGTVWNVVEKSIRKGLFYRNREARFYRHYDMLDACRKVAYPHLLGIVETPLSTLIYSQYIEGSQPVRSKLVGVAAEGIAELEEVSAARLQQATCVQAIDYWIMDFFRWPYLRHTRMNFHRFIANLEPLLDSPAQARDYARRLHGIRPWLHALANEACRSPRCICHLDYSAKNMLLSADGLYLVDWSEVKVGRIGFDGGDYLSKLFMHTNAERFAVLRQRFERDHAMALANKAWLPIAHRNMRYLFIQLALWRCLQEHVIQTFIDDGKADQLLAKLDYLLAEPEREQTTDTLIAGEPATAGTQHP